MNQVVLTSPWTSTKVGARTINKPSILIDHPPQSMEVLSGMPPTNCLCQIVCDDDTLSAIEADAKYSSTIESITVLSV
jgi:hypothetical protein